MTNQHLSARTHSMTAQTVSMSANPVVEAVAQLRSLPERSAAQRAAFRAEHDRVSAMLASPAFSLSPRT